MFGAHQSIEIPRNIRKAIYKEFSIKKVVLKPIVSPEIDSTYYFEIHAKDSILGYLCLRETNACRIGGCEIETTSISKEYFSSQDEYERFTYYFITDNELVVRKSGIHHYPGDYGFEIASKWWQNQFIGYKGEDWHYGKEIDGITGATISGYAMCYDLQFAYSILNQLILDLNKEADH